MEKEILFVDSLTMKLRNKAQENIQSTLLWEFYEEIEQGDNLIGDRKFANMSDIKEVRDAFNSFYNLTPTSEGYLS